MHFSSQFCRKYPKSSVRQKVKIIEICLSLKPVYLGFLNTFNFDQPSKTEKTIKNAKKGHVETFVGDQCHECPPDSDLVIQPIHLLFWHTLVPRLRFFGTSNLSVTFGCFYGSKIAFL